MTITYPDTLLGWTVRGTNGAKLNQVEGICSITSGAGR
jgi:hypothetical protein